GMVLRGTASITTCGSDGTTSVLFGEDFAESDIVTEVR
ncbi:hypothetical protein L195_g063305, partial [Trifolium pratense]